MIYLELQRELKQWIHLEGYCNVRCAIITTKKKQLFTYTEKVNMCVLRAVSTDGHEVNFTWC